jgi:hypothetical protein
MIQAEKNSVAGFEVEFFGAIASQFQDVLSGTVGPISGAGLALTGGNIKMDVDDLFVFIQVNDVQVNPAVFHPKAAIIFSFINKQHPEIIGDKFAVHHPCYLLLRGIGNLYHEFFRADIEGNDFDSRGRGRIKKTAKQYE